MLIFFCKEWRNFLLALEFFTRIPVPSFKDFKEEDLNHSAKYFPLVGIIVGSLGAIAFVLATYIFPINIAILISMAATIYVTGAFHEDGLADSADALGGGWEREQMLTIMQDSRLGTFGVTALFFILFTKYQALSALPVAFVVSGLILAHALSRLSVLYVMASLTYAKPSGKAKPLATEVPASDLLVATLFGLLPLLLLGGYFSVWEDSMSNLLLLALSCLLPVCLVWFWWRRKIMRWIGGYTGDCLGAMQQMTELAFYLGLVTYIGLAS